jgi:hypothetical protein
MMTFAVGMFPTGVQAAPAHPAISTIKDSAHLNVPYIVPKNRATNLCLDDSWEVGLRTFPCNGGVWQRWDVYVQTIGIVGLKSQATGKCLDLVNGLHTDAVCHFTTQQLWKVNSPVDGGGFTIQNTSGPCLDDSTEFHLRPFPCNGLGFQRWDGI